MEVIWTIFSQEHSYCSDKKLNTNTVHFGMGLKKEGASRRVTVQFGMNVKNEGGSRLFLKYLEFNSSGMIRYRKIFGSLQVINDKYI